MKQETLSEIYRDGRHYDRFFARGSEDPSFWVRQANRFGEPILELACGTGRITIALAQAGFEVSGIDIADGMLDEARRKADQAGVAIAWRKADMRDFSLDQQFSLIILPANTLCHLLSIADFEACMASVRRHLAPDGRFVVDVFVPRNELLVNRPGERFPFSEYDDPDGRGRIVVTHSYHYETDTQIKRITTYHSIPGEEVEIEGELDMRMYFPQELDALLRYNGLQIEAKYGSYDETGFASEFDKQLIVCRLMEDH